MRNLVLLLCSGHTVRIALRDDDEIHRSIGGLREFLLNFPAVHVMPDPQSEVTFAYVEDPSPPDFLSGGGMEREPLNDYQRVSVEGPGTVVQYG